ncbi:MAG: NAD+ synthase [candidate division KSB1 bacterium]|nr:NAD+ synthase [candidate division KSB1 bacterium]
MKTNSIRIALAQINPTVGDLDGNKTKILDYIRQAQHSEADLVVFPELALTGYPPEDLLLKHQFIEDNKERLHQIAQEAQGITVILGFADRKDAVYNAAAVIHNKRIAGIYYKICLPNYGVFDEKRYFKPGTTPLVFELRGTKIGLNICEDIWVPNGVTETQALKGDAEIIVNISASPFHAGKGKERQQMLCSRAISNCAIVTYTNLVGGQDELVFDGQSLIFNEAGELLEQGWQFREDLILADLWVDKIRKIRSESPEFKRRKESFQAPYALDFLLLEDGKKDKLRSPLPSRKTKKLSPAGEIYEALVLGTHDYVHKNGFQKVVIGLSGGIDSALTAVIAVDALGSENVVGVAMPSQYSSEGSITDAEQLASNLKIQLLKIPIQDTFQAYRQMLKEAFQDRPEDVTEENIQARIRGNILMALSNKFGWLALATGNKSEVSVGYCTLYGDMAGGFSVIKDVPKTLVYRLAKYRNSIAREKLIPQSILDKVPSAELRPNQKDEDSLPPYSILDPILEAYIEKDMSIKEIVALGYPEQVVQEVANMVDRNEYKRRQAAPGIKITPRAFGKDRRMPVTNRYQNV